MVECDDYFTGNRVNCEINVLLAAFDNTINFLYRHTRSQPPGLNEGCLLVSFQKMYEGDAL